MHLGPLCMQLRVPVRFFSLWESQKWGFSLRIAYFVPFYTINFFSDSPAGFPLLLGQCAALRSLAQLTTPFLASGKAAILREKPHFWLSQRLKKRTGTLSCMHKGPKCIQSLWDHPKIIPFVQKHKEGAICAIFRKKIPFWGHSQRPKKVLLTAQGCARLRTGPIIMQIPRGYQKKKVYCVERRDM